MTGRVLFDLQGTQSIDHRERGIARFVLEHALALERLRPGLVGGWLLNPDLQPPGGIEPLVATGCVTSTDSCAPVAGGVHHLASPYELSIPLDTLWPRALRNGRMRLVVTLYDLVPEVMAERYLEDPGLRHRYRARHHLVRAADRILAISHQTAADAIERLGVPPERVVVIGGGVSDRFRRAEDPAAARNRLRRLVPGVGERFVLYTGGMDDRKNIDRLLDAWARLGDQGRYGHRLVIACRMGGGERNHYASMSERLGIEHAVVFPGYTPDDVLVLLYQCADLFVFPSLYEGYGLPVAEALACGAPVIGSGTSSVGELLEADATFDPADTDAIATAVRRALRDDSYRETLAGRAEAPARWDDVAATTLAVYDDLLAAPPPAPRPRPLVAFATPLPPARTDVARYSVLLLDALRASTDVDVDVFVDGLPDTPGQPEAPSGLPVDPVAVLPAADRMRAYDHVVYCLGNSEFHIGSLASLRRRPGTVLAHDVRLNGLYRLGVGYPAAVPGGFRAAVERMYDATVPAEVGVLGFVTPEEADRYGILMAREVVGLSERFLTTSEFAAALARIDADSADVDKIGVIPFAMRLPDGWRDGVAPSTTPLVATFGVVNQVKQPETLLDAFALIAPRYPQARLAFVGAASSDDVLLLRARADDLGLHDAVTVTGEIDGTTYASWLARATVAVQLRGATNGETSGAVGNCLSAGKPTIVTSIGSARDLPDDAVVKVPLDVRPADLADAIAALLDDADRRNALCTSARAVAADHTMQRAADALWVALRTGTPARS